MRRTYQLEVAVEGEVEADLEAAIDAVLQAIEELPDVYSVGCRNSNRWPPTTAEAHILAISARLLAKYPDNSPGEQVVIAEAVAYFQSRR